MFMMCLSYGSAPVDGAYSGKSHAEFAEILAKVKKNLPVCFPGLVRGRRAESAAALTRSDRMPGASSDANVRIEIRAKR